MASKTRSLHPSFYWIGAILFMLTSLTACKAKEAEALRSPERRQVFGRKATRVSTNETIVVSGVLEADKTVPLSFLVPGKVEHVYVDEGDHVKKGQVLARVEINDYRSRLEIAEAQLLEARDAYERMWPLYKSGAIAEKVIVKIKSGFDQAKASRDIAGKKVKDTKLRSPIPGIVGARNVEPGQAISTGTPVFTIVKTDRIYARVSVPESEIGKTALGQKAVVTIKALDDSTVEGNITLIGAMAEPRTRTYTVKIELPNPDYLLRAGMIAEAQIVTDRIIEMVTIPGKAVVRDADNLTYVFLADKEKKRAVRQRVFPGSVHRSEIEIKEGVKTEDVVIVAGQHRITDGAPITIVDAGPAPDGETNPRKKGRYPP